MMQRMDADACLHQDADADASGSGSATSGMVEEPVSPLGRAENAHDGTVPLEEELRLHMRHEWECGSLPWVDVPALMLLQARSVARV